MGPLAKLDTPFDPDEYVVTNREGPRLSVRNVKTGASYDRNVAHVKRVDQRPAEETPVTTTDASETIGEGTSTRQRREKKKPARFADFVMGVAEQPLQRDQGGCGTWDITPA